MSNVTAAGAYLVQTAFDRLRHPHQPGDRTLTELVAGPCVIDTCKRLDSYMWGVES